MDPTYRAAHIREDRAHWWFRGRLRVLLAVLRAELPRRPLRLLELGCGTGNVLRALTEFGEAVGMEPDERLIAAAHAEGLDVRRGAMPADLVVPDGWADAVLLLDVLEHLDDEAGALATARRALAPAGALVVTVPAYAWLWSGHDQLLGHKRRYRAGEIRRVVERAGFRVTYTSYFNTVLFPGLVLVRLLKRACGSTQHDLDRSPTAVNGLLEWCFAIERHLVPRLALPFGLSVLLLARRS
jgi:SAM-dependent methyltransferase